MIRKIILLSFLFICVSIMAFSQDIITATEATWIECHIKSVLKYTNNNICRIYIDDTKPINITTHTTYITTLTDATKQHAIIALDMTNTGAKEIYSLIMLAITLDWKVFIQLQVGVEQNGFNTILYIAAPY